MWVYIIQGINDLVSNFLDIVMALFLDRINFRISDYINYFPVFKDSYGILKVLGYGFLLLIAGVGLYRFFFLTSSFKKQTDRVESIVIKSMVAAALIEYGGYALDELIRVAGWAFGAFNNITVEIDNGVTVFKNLLNPLTILAAYSTSTETKFEHTAVVLLCLFFGLMICWNLLKLLIELAERYLVLGLLVFTSPLFYPTMVSEDTNRIFVSWVRMLFSQTILISMSSFFLKLIVSGIAENQMVNDPVMKMLLVLAMCKIAQRADSYMNQLGFNAAITGGSLLEDIVAAGKMIGGAVKGVSKGVSKGAEAILGKNTSGESRLGGPLGGIANAVKAGKEAFKQGEGLQGINEAAARSFKNTMERTARQNGIQGVAAGISQFVAPNAAAERRANLAARAAANEQSYAKDLAGKTKAYQPVTPEMVSALEKERGAAAKNAMAESNRLNYGIADRADRSAMKSYETMDLTDNAKAAGLTATKAGDNVVRVQGPDRAVGDFIDNGFRNAASPANIRSLDEYRREAAATAYEYDPKNPPEFLPKNFDHDKYRTDYQTMEASALYNDYPFINDRAQDMLDKDIVLNSSGVELFQPSLIATIDSASAEAVASAVFDHAGTLGLPAYDNDGPAIVATDSETEHHQDAFRSIINKLLPEITEEYDDINTVSVRDLDDVPVNQAEVYDVDLLHGGRELIGTLKDETGLESTLSVLNETAYTALDNTLGYHEKEISEGRKIYWAVIPGKRKI